MKESSSANSLELLTKLLLAQESLSGHLQNDSYLASLPLELLDNIISSLTQVEMQEKLISSLASSCRQFYGSFQFGNLNRSLLQAVIDDDRKSVKRILDANTDILRKEPPENLVVESKFTYQKFFSERPLKMAARRKQLEMVKVLLPYYIDLVSSNKLEQAIIEDALSAWKQYEIQKNIHGETEIYIPQEYSKYAKFLVDVCKSEYFPKNEKLSEYTESELTILHNTLKPIYPIDLYNYIDVELFLLAAIKSFEDNYDSFNNNWLQRDIFWVQIIGLIQKSLSPETAKIWCHGLYKATDAIKNGVEIKLEPEEEACKLYRGVPFYRNYRSPFSGADLKFFAGIDRCYISGYVFGRYTYRYRVLGQAHLCLTYQAPYSSSWEMLRFLEYLYQEKQNAFLNIAENTVTTRAALNAEP